MTISTNTKQARYLNTHYGQCPNCQSFVLDGQSVEIDGNEAGQHVVCTECEADWTDIYTLTRIIDVTGFDPNEPVTDEALERAKALGFNTVAAAEEHQRWLEENQHRATLAANAVREASRTGSNTVDARHIT